MCLGEGLIYILESAPYSRGVCLSFSVNTDGELSLLWKTLQSFAHRLHYGCLTYFSTAFVLSQSIEKCCVNYIAYVLLKI